jgi:hypothetical protein
MIRGAAARRFVMRAQERTSLYRDLLKKLWKSVR